MTTPATGWSAPLMRWLTRCLLCLGLAGATAAADATAFVSYDFSSNDGGIPLVGTLTFSSEMPVTDRCCNWVSYQPSAVVNLQIGAQTWSNSATPDGYCDVWFHIGWIQVTVWCVLQEPVENLADTLFRLDFVGSGTSVGLDYPDPTGPYAPDTFRDQQVSGRLWAVSPWPDDLKGRSLSLDAVRFSPYVDEPSLPALLAAGALAGLIARRCRSRSRSNRPT